MLLVAGIRPCNVRNRERARNMAMGTQDNQYWVTTHPNSVNVEITINAIPNDKLKYVDFVQFKLPQSH